MEFSTLQDPRRRRCSGQARQLHALPWKDIPVIHRDDARGHGRHEQRIVQVVTVAGLLFPYAAQVLRIKRRRLSLRREKVVQRDRLRHHRPDRRRGERSRDRVMGSRTRWTVENTVHRVRDVVLKRTSPRSELITRPAVLAVVRDLIRSPLKLAGYVNTAAGRRAHTDRPPASSLSKASLDQIRRAGQTPGSWDDFNHSLYHAARGRYIDAVGGTSYPATSDLLHPWGMRCAVSTCRVLAV